MPEDKTAPAPPKRGYSVLNRSTSKKVPRHDSNQELGLCLFVCLFM